MNIYFFYKLLFYFLDSSIHALYICVHKSTCLQVPSFYILVLYYFSKKHILCFSNSDVDYDQYFKLMLFELFELFFGHHLATISITNYVHVIKISLYVISCLAI